MEKQLAANVEKMMTICQIRETVFKLPIKIENLNMLKIQFLQMNPIEIIILKEMMIQLVMK